MTARKKPTGSARAKRKRVSVPQVMVRAATSARLMADLLAMLDARPDVTVMTRTWPVCFVQLRFVRAKTVTNGEGFNPLHRDVDLFFGQAWEATRNGISLMPVQHFAGYLGPLTLDMVLGAIGPMSDEILIRLGLKAPAERQVQITGRVMER